MSDSSKIEWTAGPDGSKGATWNPVTGCTKVSPGCDHCYAETFAERWRGTPGHHFENGFDVQLRPERLEIPQRWRKPRRIFVNSMSDLFHEAVPDEYIARVWQVMASTPRHTYMILTKRHARMRSYLSRTWPEPLPNVWLGVSVEDQKWADIRIPALLRTPAAVRFLSCEPLLGPLDLRYYLSGWCPEHDFPGGFCVQRDHYGVQHLGWVIVGGESGPGARSMDLDWPRTIIARCRQWGVPVFLKQVGSVAALPLGPRAGRKGGNWDVWPPDLCVREFPVGRAA